MKAEAEAWRVQLSQPSRSNVLISHVGCQDIGELHTSAISIRPDLSFRSCVFLILYLDPH